MDAAVEVRGLGKIYDGGVEALRDINVSFPRGQLTTLLGPSGCGKTTLLKIIAGLIPATGGSVLVNGKPIDGPGPERAFVFQDFALLPWATTLRNAAFGLELRGVPGRSARRSRGSICARSGSSASRTATRTSSPAACGSGSASPGRWRSTPTCC